IQWDNLVPPPVRYARIVREMVKRFQPVMLGATGDDPTGHDRVFLARQANSLHKMINSDQIEDAAQQRGFVIIYPETLEFAEQVRLMSSARFVMGPEGSAMFLAFFAAPGTKLLVLNSELGVLAEHAQRSALLIELGIDVTQLTGPP